MPSTINFGGGEKELTDDEVTALRFAVTNHLMEYQNALKKVEDPLTIRCLQDGVNRIMRLAAKIGASLPRR